RVPLYISCPHQSTPLHQVFRSVCPLTSGIPVRVPPYTQSTPFYHISPSNYPACANQTAPFHHKCPSECPFPQYVPIFDPLT
ncbi:unnamed protein product, partial [Staurois parvus]